MTGTVMWRAMQPVAELQRRGYPVQFGILGTENAALMGATSDLIMLPRAMFTSVKQEKEFFKHVRNKTVCYEADDDIWGRSDYLMPVMSKRAAGNWSVTSYLARRAVRRCDGVITTTGFLAARAATVAKPGAPSLVVGNYIDLEWWRAVLGVTKRQDPSLTVGWVGGERNAQDVAILVEAWRILADRYPHVKFVTGGHPFPIFAESLPFYQYRHLPWAPLHEYPALYRQVDIGCAPLKETLFNRAKSPIKVMEYAVAGAAVVAAPLVYPTHFSAEDGVAFAATVGDWVRELSALIENPDLRARRAAATMSAVEARFTLRKNVYRWIDAWIEVWRAGRARIEIEGAFYGNSGRSPGGVQLPVRGA